MATVQRTKRWDEEYDTIRSRLAAAELKVKRALATLETLRLDQDRADGLVRRGGSMADEAAGRRNLAQVKLDEAKKNAADAKRKGLPPHLWVAETRRWTAAAEDAATDARRWADDARRAEKDMNGFTGEIKEKQVALERARKEVTAWENKLRSRSAMGRGLTVMNRRSDSNAGKPVYVTDRATAALSHALDEMPHGPDDALRLSLGSDGAVVLAVDARNPDDEVVEHGRAAVLYIGPQSVESFAGKTLDTSESPEGTQIVIQG